MKYQALLDYQTKEIELIKFNDAVKGDKNLNSFYRCKTALINDEKHKKNLDENNTNHNNFLEEIEKNLVEYQKKYEELLKKISNADSIEELKNCLNEIIKEKDIIVKNFDQIKKNEDLLAKLKDTILSVEKIKIYQEYIKANEQQILTLTQKVKGKIKQIEEEIIALRKKVPKQQLDIYDRKKIEAKNNNKNTGMVVAVIQYDCGHCRHCSLEISPDSKNKLKQGELVECESCHMLLVMEENK